ncbi:hypothetical protein [Nonomuraea sp. C10]|uniref:hypothetical protein n=1 Tax=Nonomuraea sp. C10 TaxID=2600577 RepID=UPI0011CE44C6|nr:hypothetical protein [Nonomuraea sp. C10]TXK35136.1 hypothetical protein FR742_38415 [Nonomuraea sp. C10]
MVAPFQGAELVSAAAGPEGELVVVWASRENAEALTARTVEPSGASFPDSRTAAPVSVHVATYGSHRATMVPIAGQSLAHLIAQPLPDGGVLLVGARCRWRNGAAECNAAIYDADGQRRREGVLGDGIEDVQTTPSGEIWVSYFDEGVCGSRGWGEADSPAPIGSAGLIRFRSDLDIAWRFPYDREFGGIFDCYALNVAGEDAWAYYYTNFPIVRIRAAAIAGWFTEVRGAQALVVADDRVVFVGGYGGNRCRLVAGSIRGEAFSVDRPAWLVMPNGRPVPRTATVLGRGSELHVVVGQSWLKLGFEDLVTR